jgi:hypothetical protein
LGNGLRAMLEFLADRSEERVAREVNESISALEKGPRIAPEDELLSVPEALARLRQEPQRARREKLESLLGAFLWDNQQLYGRRIEAASEAAETLGYRSYLLLREAVTGYGYESLTLECEALLAKTEDAYRDLLGYALKRLEANLKPLPQGSARAHDLQRAAAAPWMTEHFRREELLSSVTRCMSEMGLPPHAEGRILLDAEDRAGKSARAFTAGLKVPDDVRVVVRPASGMDEFSALLHQFGVAQQLANASRATSVEDRRLCDPTVLEGFAHVFDYILLDPAWHMRYLRLPQSAARDASRFAAFNSLYRLRRDCAQLAFELSLYARGPVRPLAEEYQERLSRTLLVEVPGQFYLFEIEPRFFVGRQLLGRALEAPLHGHLLERFNEDYWRNPAAGRWLKDLFASGFTDVKAVSRKLDIPGVPLAAAGDRVIQVLNA